MKKQILKAFLVIAILSAASTAMAASIATSTIIGGGSFTPSAKVGIIIKSAATSYAATSCHVNGTNQYGTVGGTGLTGTFNDPSKIYNSPIPAQSETAFGTPTAPTDATALSGSNWQ